MNHYAFMTRVLEFIKELEASEALKNRLINDLFRAMVPIVVENEGMGKEHYED
jgi:hypothetical protein